MRGCSVLFVCSLCVFVLCGAAAVVAQDETPEKAAAREARTVADALKQRLIALQNNYKYFEDMVSFVAGELAGAVRDISASNTIADALLPTGQTPSKEEIKKKIGRLEEATNASKGQLDRLKAVDAAGLNGSTTTKKLTDKMGEVENKTTEAEQAAAAVTDEIPTIDAVIEKAGALQAATGEAMTLWDAAVRYLTTRLGGLDAAIAAINATKNDIEEATEKFTNNTSPQTTNLKQQLTNAVTRKLKPSLYTLNQLKNGLRIATNTAEEAKNEYTALAAAAQELKGKAEERRQSAAKRKDYSAGPLCSLTLPVFFFCWCVLFGM